jgi:hypothetical protein
MADFGDIFSQYLSNRVNQAVEPFSNPSNYLENRLGVNTATTQAPAVGPTIAAAQGQQPENPLNQVAGAGRGFVNPAPVNPNAPEPTMAKPTEPVAKAAPVAPVAPSYAQTIGQQESGNNPNIGYHYKPNEQGQRASSAYGQFGITSAAWQDARKVDPNLPEDITQATPEDQSKALNVITDLNKKQLGRHNIEPTEQNLRLAHFLGATGAANYLNNDTISPAAAKANGGEARVRHIIGNMMKGNPVAVSGASQQPSGAMSPDQAPVPNSQPGTPVPTYDNTPPAEPYKNEYAQINEGDPINILALTKHDNPAIASAAKAKAYDLLKTGTLKQDAQATVDNALAKQQIPKFNEKTEEGSYIKAYLFARLGLNDLAQQEQEKISPTKQTMPVMLGNDHYAATYNKNGQLLYAYGEDGKPVDDATMAKIAANSYNSKTAAQHAQVYADPTGKVKGTYVLETRPNAAPVYKEIGTGRIATGDEAAAMKAQGVQGSLEYQQLQQNQKNQGKLDLLNKELQTRLEYIPAQEHNKFISKFNAENGTNFALMTGPGGKTQIVQGGAPAVQGNAPAPAVQGNAPAVQGGAPAVQGGAPVVNAPAPQPGAPTNPSEYKQQQQVSTKEQEAFIKPKSDINANSRTGKETADITRTQINDLMNTPEMIGYLTAGPGTTNGQIGKFMREVISGAYDADASGKELANKMRELSIPTALQSRIQAYQQQNVRINALTLKANEGAGSISNFENKQNQAANMSNIGDLTPYSALTGLGKRQLVGDITLAKQQFLTSHPELKTETAFENAWSKEQDRLMKGYQGIYQARLDSIKPYYDLAMKNPNDERSQQAYRDAAIASFRTYPTPDYNPQTGKWEYKTKQAKLAAMNALVGGQ